MHYLNILKTICNNFNKYKNKKIFFILTLITLSFFSFFLGICTSQSIASEDSIIEDMVKDASSISNVADSLCFVTNDGELYCSLFDSNNDSLTKVNLKFDVSYVLINENLENDNHSINIYIINSKSDLYSFNNITNNNKDEILNSEPRFVLANVKYLNTDNNKVFAVQESDDLDIVSAYDVDSDGDGVPDSQDQCPGLNDNATFTYLGNSMYYYGTTYKNTDDMDFDGIINCLDPCVDEGDDDPTWDFGIGDEEIVYINGGDCEETPKGYDLSVLPIDTPTLVPLTDTPNGYTNASTTDEYTD